MTHKCLGIQVKRFKISEIYVVVFNPKQLQAIGCHVICFKIICTNQKLCLIWLKILNFMKGRNN
jgi:hypothetical protein